MKVGLGVDDLFRRSYRWGLVLTLGVLLAIMSGLIAVYVYVRIAEAERLAANFFRQNEEYVKALAVYQNTEAIELFLEGENRRQTALVLTYLPVVSGVSEKVFRLTLGDKPLGGIHYRLRVERIVDVRVIIGILLGTVGLLMSALRLYRGTRQFLLRDLVEPLKEMGYLVSQAKEIGEFAQVGRVRSQVGEIEIIRNALLQAAERLKVAESGLREARVSKAIHEVAIQVSHDIRSPLLAIEYLVQDEQLGQIPEEKRLLVKAAAGRIRDIANNLLSRANPAPAAATARLASAAAAPPERHSPPAQADSVVFLHSVLERAASEKRWEYQSRPEVEIVYHPGPSALLAFARVSHSELSRVLSNLVNNSMEAIERAGKVELSVAVRDGEVRIAVADPGYGIAPDVLPRVGQHGYSYHQDGREGHGLGLFHARQVAESYNGQLVIESKVGRGTTVTLCFPVVEPPKWFAADLPWWQFRQLILVDDDPGYGVRWSNLVLRYRRDATCLLFFRDPMQFRSWLATQPNTDGTLFLIDHELGENTESGLSLIRELGLAARSVLVTSRYDDAKLEAACVELGVRLFPKGLEQHLGHDSV